MKLPLLPTEIWMLINNIKRQLEYNDRWGWSVSIARGTPPIDHPQSTWCARGDIRPFPKFQIPSMVLRRNGCWMWALIIYQFQYEIVEQPWSWSHQMRTSNMPLSLLSIVRAKDTCCNHINMLSPRMEGLWHMRVSDRHLRHPNGHLLHPNGHLLHLLIEKIREAQLYQQTVKFEHGLDYY